MLGLLLGSLIAGILTTLAPCVLPLLPVIVGGSVAPNQGVTASARRTDVRRAVWIAGSLAASVMLFTIILRASTALIAIPPEAWTLISGGLLVILGLVQIFPKLWEFMDIKLNLGERSNRLLPSSKGPKGRASAIATGAALGPVFSSCSPLYGWIVATVLPSAWVSGLSYLLMYAIGLSGTLLIIAILGQRAISRLRWAANPEGWFRRIIGLIFIVIGIAVVTGVDRDIQTWLVLHGPFPGIWTFDQTFIPK